MQIISHRGYWKTLNERNQRIAFKRTVASGFGTETDFRDFGSDVVVSHDPPSGNEIRIDDMIQYFKGSSLTIAANIKSDGIAMLIKQAFEAASVNYFCFDMSVPQAIQYINHGMPFYTRHSDIENAPVLYDKACGVWLDAFYSNWYNDELIREHLACNKKVCLVSSELHGREHISMWSMLKERGVVGEHNLMLCTDFPEEALKYFRSESDHVASYPATLK